MGAGQDLKDEAGFKETQAAMKDIGFDDSLIATLMQLVAAVVHIGQLEFAADGTCACKHAPLPLQRPAPFR